MVKDRIRFFLKNKWIIILLTIVYILLSVLRDFRDNFAVEILKILANQTFGKSPGSNQRQLHSVDYDVHDGHHSKSSYRDSNHSLDHVRRIFNSFCLYDRSIPTLGIRCRMVLDRRYLHIYGVHSI